jgi:2-oxoglutarate ferredoxin oxidoreductase subunit gamma
MQTEIIFSGFGGQGVLFAGQILAYAAMDAGMEVTWFPSYGPEMRGGTASCTVILSDEEIGSPAVRNPQAIVAMNLPSLDKYEEDVRAGGLLIVNRSLIDRDVNRGDVDAVYVPANEIAEELGNKRLTNMVLMGALLARLPVLPFDSLESALEAHLPAKRQSMLKMNLNALQAGKEIAEKAFA